MPRRTRTRQACALLTSLLLALGTASACSADAPVETHSQTIDPAGGTYALGDLTITVPPNAVTKTTQLTATTPAPQSSQEAPLGASHALQFDVSLADNAQPLQPLEISIPLTGQFRPDGTNPAQALLYTQDANHAYQLIPALVDSQAVLHAKLPHLSPKVVVYANDLPSTKLLDPGGITPTKHIDCAQVMTASPLGSVVIGQNRAGWSDNPDSPIRPCLVTHGSQLDLQVTNQAGYTLSVATSSGVTVASQPADAEEEIVKLIASRLFPDPRVKAFVSTGKDMTASLAPGSLPATVELIASPNTFLAQSAWITLKFSIGLLTGQDSTKLAKQLNAVVESVGVVNCLQSAAHITAGTTPSLWDLVQLMTSKCTQPIAEALGQYVQAASAWDAFWGRFFTLGGGVIDALGNTITAIQGIRLQFTGTMHVEVLAATTAKPAPTCPTEAQFNQAANAYYKAGANFPTQLLACQDGWAIGLADTPNGNGPTAIVRLQNGKWTVVSFYHHQAICSQLPAKIKGLAGC